MMLLTQEQIQDIKNNLTITYGITAPDLRDALLDDLSCAIKELMEQRLSYAAAKSEVFKSCHKSLLPYPLLSYGHMPWFLVKKWLIKGVENFTISLIMAFTVYIISTYLFSGAHYEVIMTYGLGFLSLTTSAITFFISGQPTNYRSACSQKYAQSLGFIALFNFVFLIVPRQQIAFAPLLLSFLFLQLYTLKETYKLNNLHLQSNETTR